MGKKSKNLPILLESGKIVPIKKLNPSKLVLRNYRELNLLL